LNRDPSLAASITRSGSRQTYYTFCLLADRDRIEDAYRAYAYFRWLDDCLDRETLAKSERRDLLKRQKRILEESYDGKLGQDACPEEQLLVDLVRQDPDRTNGLHTYLHDMMAVMAFDAARCGRLISQMELNRYTQWLACSVTEAMHYFIGHDAYSPRDETRYLAVSAAHITHMLRDTVEDALVGYYNIPSEYLQANSITPRDVDCDAYRTWVKSRVQLARSQFQEGRKYLKRVANPRCRLAGYAYTARFESLLDTIEREEYHLRPTYAERKSLASGWRMGWQTLAAMLGLNKTGAPARPLTAPKFEERP
jgi:phytoene/squalene synthetase